MNYCNNENGVNDTIAVIKITSMVMEVIALEGKRRLVFIEMVVL